MRPLLPPLLLYGLGAAPTHAQQAYCWEPCALLGGCASQAPVLCPPEEYLTYYECCPGFGCCQYVKWPNR